MKKIVMWIVGLGALALGAWYFFFRKPATPARTQQTTNTANTAPQPWFPGWSGFNQQSLDNVTKTQTSFFDGLKQLANNFGVNDGGRNPGVSVGGSKAGGTQSSGSGAALPVSDNSSDLGVQTSVADQSSDAPLNGYDDSDYNDFGDDGTSFDA